MNKIMYVKLITITCVILSSAYLLCGCLNKEQEQPSKKEQQIDIETDYNKGKYTPKDSTYTIDLPTEDWIIQGEENSTDITFEYKNNIIHIQTFTGEQMQSQIKNLPTSQTAYEQLIKKENIYSYDVKFFDSSLSYTKNSLLNQTNFCYYNYTSTQNVIHKYIYTNECLYLIKGIVDSENYDSVRGSLDNFKIYNKDKTEITLQPDNDIKQTEGNVYTSSNNNFQLFLPYEKWKFKPDLENKKTTITSKNKNFIVTKMSNRDYQNKIKYEIPKDLKTLKKQINMLKLGKYEILSFDVKIVGNVDNYVDEKNYMEYSFLIKVKKNKKIKFYSGYEYRNQYNSYHIEATTKSKNIKIGEELLKINKSFQPNN